MGEYSSWLYSHSSKNKTGESHTAKMTEVAVFETELDTDGDSKRSCNF